MDYYLTLEHWNSMVRQMKDAEREYDIPASATSDLAKDILLVIRSTRFRQGVLFKQKRGEEYEKFRRHLPLGGHKLCGRSKQIFFLYLGVLNSNGVNVFHDFPLT